MIAKHLDERHVARGFDPYNSADQPHMIAAVNARDHLTDAQIQRAMRYLVKHPQIAANILSSAIEKRILRRKFS